MEFNAYKEAVMSAAKKNPAGWSSATSTPAKSPEEQNRRDKQMHENRSEKEIDKTLKDTFPASDPPAY